MPYQPGTEPVTGTVGDPAFAKGFGDLLTYSSAAEPSTSPPVIATTGSTFSDTPEGDPESAAGPRKAPDQICA